MASETNPAKAVSFENVTKQYHGQTAVDAVSLDVRQGEIVTLLGPSGSGKSTLLSMVAGVIYPDAGRITLDGRDITHVPPHSRNIGMVFQRYTLFPNKTVAENIAFPLQVRNLSKAEIADKVKATLDLVQLSRFSERYPSQISGGQAQRVAVARALVFGPSVLLMDEPLAALDKALRSDLQDEIRFLQRRTGVPTIYVTHDQEEAMHLADRIVIFRGGKIAAEGAPKILYNRPPSLWTAQFLGDANIITPQVPPRPHPDGAVDFSFQGRTFTARKPDDASGGKAPVLIVRPENCQVFGERPVDGWAIPGVVELSTFLGARQRVRVRFEDGSTLTASVAGAAATGDVGQTVYCRWSEDSLIAVQADGE